MPRLIWSANARLGLERCRLFLQERNPPAAARAAQAILKQTALLREQPKIGRPYEHEDGVPIELRELVIHFGGSGYVAKYHFDEGIQTIEILAFRHRREAGYDEER